MKTPFIVLIVIFSVLAGLTILWLIYRRCIGVELSAEIESVGDGGDNNNNNHGGNIVKGYMRCSPGNLQPCLEKAQPSHCKF